MNRKTNLSYHIRLKSSVKVSEFGALGVIVPVSFSYKWILESRQFKKSVVEVSLVQLPRQKGYDFPYVLLQLK